MEQEKQRISERLVRLDGEREKLSVQFSDLEVAERVLSRFGEKAVAVGKRRRARPAKTEPSASEERGARSKQRVLVVSLNDAAFRAVQAHGEGATASDVLDYLSREFGLAVRPNHLGLALQRHRRAGQLEIRNQRWY